MSHIHVKDTSFLFVFVIVKCNDIRNEDEI